MLKVNVSVVPCWGSKGPGYLARCEGVSAYHPSVNVALALVHEQVSESLKAVGWSGEVVVVNKERGAEMREELREYRQRVAQLIVESINELESVCSCREEKREPGTCKPCREIHRLYKALDALKD